jgi:hypothetical protein
VIQVASCSNDDVSRLDVATVVMLQQRLVEPADRILCPQNRLSQRMILLEILGEDLMDEVIGIVLIHLDLFEYHA